MNRYLLLIGIPVIVIAIWGGIGWYLRQHIFIRVAPSGYVEAHVRAHVAEAYFKAGGEATLREFLICTNDLDTMSRADLERIYDRAWHQFTNNLVPLVITNSMAP